MTTVFSAPTDQNVSNIDRITVDGITYANVHSGGSMRALANGEFAAGSPTLEDVSMSVCGPQGSCYVARSLGLVPLDEEAPAMSLDAAQAMAEQACAQAIRGALLRAE